MADNFLLYRSVFDSLMALDGDTCKESLRMIGQYAMDGKIPETPGVAFAMFMAVRPLLDYRAKKVEAGRKGGLTSKPKQTEAEPKQTEASAEQTEAKVKSKKEKEKIIKDKREKQEKEKVPYKEIVDYLNEKTGKAFSDKSKETRSHINARFDDGYTLDDFKKVIDTMTGKWKGDAKMRDFLRPQTLFSTKFESYLNATPGRPKPTNQFNNFQQRQYDFEELERRLTNQ